MKTIRTITTIFVAVLLLTVNGYSQNTDVKTLLDKQETKKEVFNTILGDHQLMMEFMTAMKGNEHAMMMMQNSDSQMKEMKGMNEDGAMKSSSTEHKMHQGEMMGMMKDNPEMMKKMMEMCMKDSTMRCAMAEMMSQQPEMMKSMKMKMGKNEKTGLDKMNQTEDKDNNHSKHKHK
jgi:hypothetical protein